MSTWGKAVQEKKNSSCCHAVKKDNLFIEKSSGINEILHQ